MAMAGGLALLATALLTAVSVTRRWLTSQPVPGDFELVAMGSGLAVMGFLAQGTVQRTNIFVDSLTSWLPGALTRALDVFWMLVWCVVAAALAERLFRGARETLANGTTTMVLGVPTWWAVGLGAVGFAATACGALYVATQLARGR